MKHFDFGPIMNASNWISGKFTPEKLVARLKTEDNTKGTIYTIQKGKGIAHCLSSSGNLSDLDSQIGKTLTYVIDTGVGYRWPSDHVVLLNVREFSNGVITNTLNGDAGFASGSFYVFK
jgi:hypothetical protein